jgi:phosphoglycerate dehydrogenase-like enzyme
MGIGRNWRCRGAAWLLMLAGGTLAPWACAQDDAAAALVRRFDLQESAVPLREQPGWSRPTRIVAVLPYGVAGDPRERLAELRAVAGGAEVVAVEDPAALPAALPGAQVLLGSCTPETVAAGTALRWIQHYYVGVERCVAAPGLRERGILVTNSKQLAGPQIAEHVIALTLALGRGLPYYARAQQRAEWDDRTEVPQWELEGKTMLVVGLGGIGTEVAQRAHALGMRVIATRGSGREGPAFVEYVGLPDELHALAARADVVVNCTPLTLATTGLFDRAFFRAMKRGGYLVNIGRGRSVVTADLVEALRAGELAGAGLDVTDPEPLPADSPLWAMDNVILTPHVAAGSDVAPARVWTLVKENLRRYVAGERMLNLVDVDKGY